MSQAWRSAASAVPLAAFAVACAGPSGAGRRAEEPVRPPQVAADMPLDKALEAAIDFGGDTLAEVKRLIKRRDATAEAQRLLEPAIRAGIESYEHHQLLNAGHLLASLPAPLPLPLFKELLTAPRPLARQLGWQLAAGKPAPAVAAAVDEELSRAIGDNDLESVLMPQMANAVRANRLTGAYTLMRQGLMVKGDEEFAAAMFAVDPGRAPDDALAYLALAPAEELRQLTLVSVNLYTVLAVLRQYQSTPPGVGAAGFEHLLVYAVSRNIGLAELAQTVVESYIPKDTEILAQALARQPAWVQVAFLENARRRMSPKLGLLLAELRKATAEDHVVREIDEIKL